MHHAYFQWVPHYGDDYATVHPDLEQKEGSGTAGLDLSKAIIPTKESLAMGKKAFEMKCAACHGIKGNGMGAPAIKPRNFTKLEGWKNGYELSNIYKTLTHGLNAMPAFSTETPSMRLALAHYVQTFATYPIPNQSDIDFLDSEYALSKGSKEPSIVPVVVAIKNLDHEFRTAHPDFKKKKVLPVILDVPETDTDSVSVEAVEKDDSVEDSKELTQADFEALQAKGKNLYQAKCVACHQPNGQGLPGAFPPLAKSDYLAKATIKRFTQQVYLGSAGLGSKGLVVNGVKYSPAMAAMSQDSKEITALANYVLNTWGNSFGPVKESQVKEYMK